MLNGQLALPLLDPDHNNQLTRRITNGWQTQAACGQAPGNAFYLERAQAGGRVEAAALETCNGCRVRSSCRAAALLNGEPGIWGGTTAADRQRLHDALASGASVDAVLLETIHAHGQEPAA